MKTIIFAMLMVLAAISTSAWSTDVIQTGTDSHKLTLIFIPSGYDNETDFLDKVDSNLDRLWSNNFFSDYKQRFDVLVVTDQYNSDLMTDTEIISLIDEHDTCNWYDPDCQKIHIVLENSDNNAETRHEFVRLSLHSDNIYTIAHEISVHVLGYLYPFGGPYMKDEYNVEKNCQDHTYTIINAHDKDSNEKWSDLEPGSPAQGAAYCSYFFRPTENAIAKSSVNKDCDNVGYKAAEIGLSKRTKDGVYELGKPTVTVGNVLSVYSGTENIIVNATDESGIDRVEFYMSINGAEYRSVKIDRTVPYTLTPDLTPDTEYYLRIYVFDEAWNYFGGNRDGLQFGPIYSGAETHPADTNEDKCVDMEELQDYIIVWKLGNTGLPNLMQALALWKEGC